MYVVLDGWSWSECTWPFFWISVVVVVDMCTSTVAAFIYVVSLWPPMEKVPISRWYSTGMLWPSLLQSVVSVLFVASSISILMVHDNQFAFFLKWKPVIHALVLVFNLKRPCITCCHTCFWLMTSVITKMLYILYLLLLWCYYFYS